MERRYGSSLYRIWWLEREEEEAELRSAQLATALPQGAHLGGQRALLLLAGLALCRLGPQLGVHRGQLGLELRLLLESLEGRSLWHY